MKTLKVIKVQDDSLAFNDGTVLYSDHYEECYESH